MKNIFLVFIQDLKRISTNVVAIVVLIGLTVIPSLYAWFNTLSNWDPYGTESTSRIKVAVASDDPGVTIDGVTVNIGDQIISNLKPIQPSAGSLRIPRRKPLTACTAATTMPHWFCRLTLQAIW